MHPAVSHLLSLLVAGLPVLFGTVGFVAASSFFGAASFSMTLFGTAFFSMGVGAAFLSVEPADPLRQ